MKHIGGDLKVKWNHNGQKYKFILTREELTENDAFEVSSSLIEMFNYVVTDSLDHPNMKLYK